VSTAHALTSGYHLAFIIGAGLVAVAISLAVSALRPPRTAEQPDSAFERELQSEAA
jgi:hypothetical protein